MKVACNGIAHSVVCDLSSISQDTASFNGTTRSLLSLIGISVEGTKGGDVAASVLQRFISYSVVQHVDNAWESNARQSLKSQGPSGHGLSRHAGSLTGWLRSWRLMSSAHVPERHVPWGNMLIDNGPGGAWCGSFHSDHG